MNINRLYSLLVGLLMLALATPVLTSCTAEDNPVPKDEEVEVPEEMDVSELIPISCNDLEYLQNTLCSYDENGQFEGYVWGEALDENDPDHLYVGVDGIEEAFDILCLWLADDIDWKALLEEEYPSLIETEVEAPEYLEIPLTDIDGTALGTITFSAGSGDVVAEVTISVNQNGTRAGTRTDINLGNVRYTFLDNKGWPNKQKAFWNVGDKVRLPVEDSWGLHSMLSGNDKRPTFVCVRQGGNGMSPLWLAISFGQYEPLANACKAAPSLSSAKEVGTILQGNFSFFQTKFDEAGFGKLTSTESYITSSESLGGVAGRFIYRSVIMLSNNYVHGVRYDPKLPLLFIKYTRDDNWFCKATNSSHFKTGDTQSIFMDDDNSWWFHNNSKSKSDVSGKDCWFVEFESYNAFTPKGYKMYSQQDRWFPFSYPTSWALYGKIRGRDAWTLLDSREGQDIGTTQSYDMSANSKEYQYFRLEMYTGSEDKKNLGILQLTKFDFIR